MASTSNLLNEKKPENIVWIEEVILNNLEENGGNLLVSDETDATPHASAPLPKRSMSDSNMNMNSPSEAALSHNSISSTSSPELKIGIAEIELKDENFFGDDRIHSLSRIVTGKIKYFIENRENDDDRYTYWLIKLPNLIHPQRQLAQWMDASRREISFYTEMLPRLREFLTHHPPSKPIEFQVPTCFYGKYNRQYDTNPDLDIITHILDSESVLVLEDLRACGYGKRHFGTGLLMNEAMAAIDEIIKFHVTTWAIQEIEGKKLSWQNLYDIRDLTRLYVYLLERCFSPLKEFLGKSKHPQASAIAIKLAKLQPNLPNLFPLLLAPPPRPLPCTLIHMDLWSENILFRMDPLDKESGKPMKEIDLDCCILDWQLVSVGCPTHDLALLLMLSMEPENRRSSSMLLLKYYYEKFRTTASYFNLEVKFSFDMLVSQFKRSCVLATLMAMASIDVVLMEESTQYRLVEALDDLIEDQLL